LINKEEISQELLLAKYLQNDKKGEYIFLALDEFFKENFISSHGWFSSDERALQRLLYLKRVGYLHI